FLVSVASFLKFRLEDPRQITKQSKRWAHATRIWDRLESIVGARLTFGRPVAGLTTMLWPLGRALAGQRVPTHSLAGRVGQNFLGTLRIEIVFGGRGCWELGPSA